MSTNICYFIFCTLWRQTILIKSLYFQIKRVVREIKEESLTWKLKKQNDLNDVNNHLYEYSIWNRFFHRCQEFAQCPFKCKPFIGKSSLPRQLHGFCGSVSLGCSIFFVMLIYLILCLACKNNWVLLFLWKIFINLWFGRKCSVIKLMNILAILVFTDLLYRGLTQMLPYLFFSLHFDCPIRQSPVQN